MAVLEPTGGLENRIPTLGEKQNNEFQACCDHIHFFHKSSKYTVDFSICCDARLVVVRVSVKSLRAANLIFIEQNH